MSEQICNIPTYHEDGRGHAKPTAAVKISIGQGVTLQLGSGTSPPDVYVERRDGFWTINVAPQGFDIEVVVRINDDGSMIVTDDGGDEVLRHEIGGE